MNTLIAVTTYKYRRFAVRVILAAALITAGAIGARWYHVATMERVYIDQTLDQPRDRHNQATRPSLEHMCSETWLNVEEGHKWETYCG